MVSLLTGASKQEAELAVEAGAGAAHSKKDHGKKGRAEEKERPPIPVSFGVEAWPPLRREAVSLSSSTRTDHVRVGSLFRSTWVKSDVSRPEGAQDPSNPLTKTQENFNTLSQCQIVTKFQEVGKIKSDANASRTSKIYAHEIHKETYDLEYSKITASLTEQLVVCSQDSESLRRNCMLSLLLLSRADKILLQRLEKYKLSKKFDLNKDPCTSYFATETDKARQIIEVQKAMLKARIDRLVDRFSDSDNEVFALKDNHSLSSTYMTGYNTLNCCPKPLDKKWKDRLESEFTSMEGEFEADEKFIKSTEIQLLSATEASNEAKKLAEEAKASYEAKLKLGQEATEKAAREKSDANTAAKDAADKAIKESREIFEKREKFAQEAAGSVDKLKSEIEDKKAKIDERWQALCEEISEIADTAGKKSKGSEKISKDDEKSEIAAMKSPIARSADGKPKMAKDPMHPFTPHQFRFNHLVSEEIIKKFMVVGNIKSDANAARYSKKYATEIHAETYRILYSQVSAELIQELVNGMKDSEVLRRNCILALLFMAQADRKLVQALEDYKKEKKGATDEKPCVDYFSMQTAKLRQILDIKKANLMARMERLVDRFVDADSEIAALKDPASSLNPLGFMRPSLKLDAAALKLNPIDGSWKNRLENDFNTKNSAFEADEKFIKDKEAILISAEKSANEAIKLAQEHKTASDNKAKFAQEAADKAIKESSETNTSAKDAAEKAAKAAKEIADKSKNAAQEALAVVERLQKEIDEKKAQIKSKFDALLKEASEIVIVSETAAIESSSWVKA